MLDKIIKLNIINPNLRVINNAVLTFACQNNLIEIVKSLLLYDSIDVNLNIPKTGDTPLITSIKRYNNEITKLLINNSKIKIDNLNQNFKRYFKDIYDKSIFQTIDNIFNRTDEIEALYKYFKKTHEFISDYYITSIKKFFISITIKPILGYIIRRFYYPSD